MDQALWTGDGHAEIFETLIEGLDPIRGPVCRAPVDTSNLIAPSRVPMDRSTALALMVAKGAAEAAELDLTSLETDRLGVFWGSGLAGAHTFDHTAHAMYVEHKRMRPTNVVTIMPNAPASEIALWSKAQGVCMTYACACASSAVAIGEAMFAIRSGRLDVAIVGGSESMLSPAIIAGWQAMRVLAQISNDPAKACKPFDRNRTGFVLGEGAAALILESSEHASRRRANEKARLSGYGASSDGVHITNPDPQGQIRAMRMALNDAGLQPSDIGYINAHGTATIAGDLAESRSISEVFQGLNVPVSSTKGLHGHMLGAGGAMELVVALRALENKTIPPTANLVESDPAIVLNLSRNCESAPNIRNVMSNSFAFGGTNAVLVASVI